MSGDDKMIYLMTPDMFGNLSNVRGFNEMNGYTYQEYIVKQLPILPKELEEKILKTETIDDALDILLMNNMSYTHDFLLEK
jgi:hypothetical protein